MGKGDRYRKVNQDKFNQNFDRIFNKRGNKMKEYTSTITVTWSLNNHEATSEQDYRDRVKDQFYDEYGITLSDDEIKDVEEL